MAYGERPKLVVQGGLVQLVQYNEKQPRYIIIMLVFVGIWLKIAGIAVSSSIYIIESIYL